jgi:hypothetical protein
VIAFALAVALAAPPAPEPPVVVTARAVPDTTRIGSPVRYEVEVTLAPEVEVVFGQPAERLGAFEIVDFGEEVPRERDGRRILTRWFTLVGFEVGHHLVPSPPVAYRMAGAALTPVEPVETRISVEGLVGDDLASATLRDIAPPLPMPRDWSGALAVGGAVAALIALLATAWWWSRRRAGRALGPPPVPADIRASAALAALAARRLPERGEVKVYYAELSGIVRRYLEDRFGVRAPEMTTEEFLVATSRGAALNAAHRGLLAEFLRESDLVKFARHRPTVDAATRALEAARRFVDETRPATAEAAA